MRPQPNTSTLVGAVLADRYRLGELLGSGGMASVHLAEHITLGKRVAVKILDHDLCRDRAHVDRFLQEARAASMIGHDNIVDIIDFGPVPGGSVFYAMEYLEGETLAARLDREGRIPWAHARDIMMQIARALRAAHEKGVVHRDLKPANCFLVRRPDGRPLVKVLDFGIARVTDPELAESVRTTPGSVFGTAKYMAPEQACGAPADARTDIYAAAVCLYELLTGTVPYDGDSFVRVLNRHITEPLTPPTTRAPDADISLAVEAVIVKALAKKPDDRYQTMAELEAALSAIELDGNLAAPRDPGPPLVGPGLARPNGGGPTGTIWLGPPHRSAPTRTPTILLEPRMRAGDTRADWRLPAGAPTWAPTVGPFVQLHGDRPPGRPRSPATAAPPNANDTMFARRSSLPFVAVVLVGAFAAVAAGALAAWLLIGGWPSLAEPAAPDVAGADRVPVAEEPVAVGAVSFVSPAAPPPPPSPRPAPVVDSIPREAPQTILPPVADAPEPTRAAVASKRRHRHPRRGRTAIDIGRGFSRARAEARACLGKASRSRVGVLATLGASGEVLHVQVLDQHDAALASCIRDAVESRARFARSTQPLEVRYWSFNA